MKRNVAFGSVGVAFVVIASAALTGDKTKSAEAFDRLTSLKGEWTGWHTNQTPQEAQLSIFEYIKVFYNRQRRHLTLSYLSPAIYEQHSSG